MLFGVVVMVNPVVWYQSYMKCSGIGSLNARYRYYVASGIMAVFMVASGDES